LDYANPSEKRIRNFYGRAYEDRSASFNDFKVLIQRKGVPSGIAIDAPSWHLDTLEMSSCFGFDFTSSLSISDRGMELSNSAYEKAKIALRLLDWLIAHRGCTSSSQTSFGIWSSHFNSLAEEVGNGSLAAIRGDRPPQQSFECLALVAWQRWCGA
jgi:hypothetical protein